jgi:single-stranded DNA-binding protein
MLFYRCIPVDGLSKQAESVVEAVNAGNVVLGNGNLRWKSWLDNRGEKRENLVVLA